MPDVEKITWFGVLALGLYLVLRYYASANAVINAAGTGYTGAISAFQGY